MKLSYPQFWWCIFLSPNISSQFDRLENCTDSIITHMQSSVVWASCTTGLKYKNDCDGPWYTDTFHFHCTDRSLYLHLRYFSVIYMLYNNIINPLGVRFFWKTWSRFQKLVARKGLKIEIYCKLENFWAWPKVYVWCKYTHRICILWRHHGGGPLEFHNIQEIVDIE